MSRVGKKPVPLPAGVSVRAESGKIFVKGKFGELNCDIPSAFSLSIFEENKSVAIVPYNKATCNTADWGRVRSLLANMVSGVADKFSKIVEVEGVGYRVVIVSKMLKLYLGHSHAIVVMIPDDVEVKTEGNNIIVTSISKERVGAFCAFLVGLRPVEPYKGKGVKRRGDFIYRKDGKKK